MPDTGQITVNIGQGGWVDNGGDTVVEAGQDRLTARGGEVGIVDGAEGWSGGGGGLVLEGRAGRGGSNGGDGEAEIDTGCLRGRGSGAVLPSIPGFVLAPGRGGEPDDGQNGGGGYWERRARVGRQEVWRGIRGRGWRRFIRWK